MSRQLLGFLGFLFLVHTSCKLQNSETNLVSNEPQKEWLISDIKPIFNPPAPAQVIISAHRGGGDYEGYPENCIESFDYIIGHTPALIECDVRTTADGQLVLLHDETLDRTTTGSGKLEDKKWKEIKDLKLIDNLGNTTDYNIPKLEDALKWAKGKAVLTLDVKRKTSFEKVIECIRANKAENYIVFITYTVEAAKKVHALAPELMLSCTIRNDFEFGQYEESGIPWENIVAFTGLKESPTAFYEKLNAKGVLSILGNSIQELPPEMKSLTRLESFYTGDAFLQFQTDMIILRNTSKTKIYR